MALAGIFSNGVFLSIVFSAILVQGVKVIIKIYKTSKLKFWDFFVTGGMPSSHTAIVVSLVFGIFLKEGMSTAFLVSLVLLAIVLRDAMGVRRAVGEEGEFMLKMAKKLKVKMPKVHVSRGHTPAQVLVGALIAIVVTIAVFSIV